MWFFKTRVRYFWQFLLVLNVSSAFLYDRNNVLIISGDEANDFGYSVFMQEGNPSRIVIGAPKGNENHEGSVWVCPFQQSNATLHARSFCNKYSPLNDDANYIKHNNLFGAAIDGGIQKDDPILIGCPKYTRAYFSLSRAIHGNIGAIYLLSDLIKKSTKGYFPGSANEQQIRYGKYYAAFQEVGFSIHYINKSQNFLIGAPGFYHWSGNAYIQIKQTAPLPPQAKQLQTPKVSEQGLTTTTMYSTSLMLKSYQSENSLTGYSVASGLLSNKQLFYAIGSPRDKAQSGSVIVVESNMLTARQELFGDQFGEFFGSSICIADINADGLDDLIIAAPTYFTSDSYDNGRIYIFINDKKDYFVLKQKVDGEHASRFGTSITSLGNIGKTGYDAIAIGAPYADSKGAIYIYQGGPNGLQKLDKINFDSIESFGYTMSKPADVDKNGVPDLAVGAYKSNKVVILKGKPVFYYSVVIMSQPQLFMHLQQPSFVIKYCISLRDIDRINADVLIVMDERIRNNIIRHSQIFINKMFCHEQEVYFKQNIERTESLEVFLNISFQKCPDCPVVSPMHDTHFTKYIPFLYDCGDDKICEPDLDASINFDRPKLIVGESNNLNVKIQFENRKEPAYTCKLDVILNEGVNIARAPNVCADQSCLLKHILKRETLNIDLDIRKIHFGFPDELKLIGSLSCLNYSKKFQNTLPLVYNYKLLVDGVQKKVPYDSKSVNFSRGSVDQFQFNVENQGPSVIKSHQFSIRLPKRQNNVVLLKVFEIEYYHKDITCTADSKFDVENADDPFQDASLASSGSIGLDNRPKDINCLQNNVECLVINCALTSMSAGSSFIIKINVKPLVTNILKYYKSTFSIGAILTDGSTLKFQSDIFYIDDNDLSYNYLWVILVSAFIGFLVLGALIYGAYKYGFFERNRQRLINEESNENLSGDIEMKAQEANAETN